MTAEADTAQPSAERLYEVYVFDLDGTIYLGDDLLPGARRLVRELRARDKTVRFLSNNPTKDPEEYADKLERLGLPTPVDEIVNTTVTMTQWLRDNASGAVVFPIAEAPLRRSLEAAGIRMSDDPAEIDVVVASYDRGFDYAKLQIAFDAIWFHRRARLVATNPDPFCPFPGGRGEPDCAAVTAAIEACTGARCEAVVGKPNPVMIETALDGVEVDDRNCLMAGDRYATDIRMGLDLGIDTALVLTGETTAADVAELEPDDSPTIVVERIDRLLPDELWAELGWSEDGDDDA
ncbi:MAG: HAD-IIA family hydrolase [Solirubrobacteraceae bacterium]